MKILLKDIKKINKTLKLLTPEKQTIKFSSGIVVLKKGQSVGEHTTENKEEVIFVVEGKGWLLVNGKKYKKLNPNYFVYIPKDVKHNIVNNSSEVLKYFYLTTKVI
ncbi:MAG: cupin domain-containing protein [Endomicrobiia bacterium]